MIIYKELRWGNAFSYGPTNKIRLDASPLTQLVGKNGHGKSSIGLILEEVQFNTNSKKVKKADVLNRYTKDKNYFIELDFEKDGNSYTISTKRTVNTGTAVLTCNGVDISSHTATGTYKQLEHILGYDHKTFSQIVYQSSVSSLEFLTATDTARKKFLIELLNLTHYTKANEVFKKLANETSVALEVAQGKVNTIEAWLKKYEKEDLNLIDLVPEPEAPTAEVAELAELELAIKNIDATNKKIAQNNKYKELLDAIELDTWVGDLPDRNVAYNNWKVELAELQKKLKDGVSLASKCKGPTTKCPTCSQDVDNSTMFNMAQEFEHGRKVIELRITELQAEIKAFEALETKYSVHQKKLAEYEKYHALYDPSKPSELLDEAELDDKAEKVGYKILMANKGIEIARKHNTSATAHNTKVGVITAQMVDMHNDLSEQSQKLIKLTSEYSDLQILAKSFSTTGLVAYKIECLVKDLEELTNTYLAALAEGRFQLSFQITSSDKLNVVITDNGRDISIDALSSGERARVNVATLLAIRKLMQSLSNSRTNLLILDETIENLDAEGKEKLVEVLLEEESLNTFLISHGFSHPLLEKLNITKVNNVSRIE
jgi:DNA repair exonuclease SbcCD ATPase subunit